MALVLRYTLLLDLECTGDVDGVYSFIVPSSAEHHISDNLNDFQNTTYYTVDGGTGIASLKPITTTRVSGIVTPGTREYKVEGYIQSPDSQDITFIVSST